MTYYCVGKRFFFFFEESECRERSWRRPFSAHTYDIVREIFLKCYIALTRILTSFNNYFKIHHLRTCAFGVWEESRANIFIISLCVCARTFCTCVSSQLAILIRDWWRMLCVFRLLPQWKFVAWRSLFNATRTATISRDHAITNCWQARRCRTSLGHHNRVIGYWVRESIDFCSRECPAARETRRFFYVFRLS